MRYTSGLNWNSQDYGEDSVQLVVNDLGSTGAGGAKTATMTLGVVVLPVNDAPVINFPGIRRDSTELRGDGKQTATVDTLVTREDEDLPIHDVFIEDVDADMA